MSADWGSSKALRAQLSPLKCRIWLFIFVASVRRFCHVGDALSADWGSSRCVIPTFCLKILHLAVHFFASQRQFCHVGDALSDTW